MEPTPVRPRTRAEARRLSPVFVDRSGRRLRRIRVLVIGGIAALAAYLVLAIASLMGVPAVQSPLLPQPISAQPAPPPITTPSPTAAEPSPTPSTTQPLEPLPVESPSPVDPAGSEASVPSPAPTAADPAPGSAPAPDDRGKSATAPGRSNAPTPPGKP